MNKITNNFNEIIIGKTLTSRQGYSKESTNNQFSSLLNNNNSNNQEQEEKKEEEQPLETMLDQQVELQNTSYLNKAFLFSVA